VVDFKDPTNIPLELILATTQPLDTKVLKKVTRAADGEVSFLTMEKGTDGIVLSTNDTNEIVKLSQAFERSGAGNFALKEATVVGIAHCGMGDRACVDTTSELFQDEGMIIGSTSSGGLMICSETHFLPYMNLRPFRVNAGALHSYIWGPDNFVPYLCDLRAGDRVYAVNARGVGRVVTVGRVKLERRPLLRLEAEIDKVKVNTFIQDDWHVRVFGSKGEIRPSSEVRIGDKLLGFADSPGRHVGIKISETIKEA
jgi:3-dehydroquinate synthase class II